MKRLFLLITLFIVLPVAVLCQKVTYSDFEHEDTRDINFYVIGKMNGNVLVYKNIKWRHKINILGDDMQIKETIKLDFMPDKTFNVDFITYPDYFYIIYEYQKKNTVYCMGVKMDGEGKKISEPVQLDTTQIAVLGDNKIYSTIYSEDKQKIMVFKMPKRNDRYSLVSMLFNNSLKLIANKNRLAISFDEQRDNFNNFSIDNEGNFVFTKDSKPSNRDNSNSLTLVIKEPTQDTFAATKIDLNKYYFDDVNLKIDNLSKRYILNTFYYKKPRGNIEGLFTCFWDKINAKPFTQVFTVLSDSLRNAAKKTGQLRFALDDFFIRKVFAEKDGGVLIIAEDYSSQTNNGSWNRWDYLNNNYYSPYSYYYNPYNGDYRPLNSYGSQSTRYFYANILILNLDKTGKMEWSRVINKDQVDDNDDNFLSFSTMNNGGEIHFLFNDDKNNNQIIDDQSISATGKLANNRTLKSHDKGYQFMPRLSKQVGIRQVIIPCVYRGYICFAKVDL